MPGPAARRIEISEIPVIDVSPLHAADGRGLAEVAAALTRAAVDPGFFYVRNHGVPRSVLANARAVAERFFALPLDEKLRVRVEKYHRGFVAIGQAKMYDGARPDLKESFVYGLEAPPDSDPAVADHPLLRPNRWPQRPEGFRTALEAFFDAMSACAASLLQAFAVAMGRPPTSFIERIERPVSRGSLVYYPARRATDDDERFGVAPHTDFGCLTLLDQDDVGGLEVLSRSGEWVTAHPVEGTLVVNVGDLLARWTNDTFRSTAHRVVNRSGRSRLSLALFFDPDLDTVIDPRPIVGTSTEIRYPPVTCGEYVLSRYGASFDYLHGSGHDERAASDAPDAAADPSGQTPPPAT